MCRLEYGEEHVAIRDGTPQETPDNVVQPFGTLAIGLYASEAYIRKHGQPRGDADYANHYFVGSDDAESRAPFSRWLHEAVPAERIVFRCSDILHYRDAILAGGGIGFMAKWDAQRVEGLVEIAAPRDDWSAPFWLVTHVDLHRTTKVQTFLKFLKEEAKSWEIGL